MELPYSAELNIGYLSHLFDNTSNCYKFFWFLAILKRNKQLHLIYYFLEFSALSTYIEISDKWIDYLFKHREILKAWIQMKLILYLQTRNPSVPGIAEKLELSTARDMARVSKYWKLVIQLDPSLKDIYGGVELTGESISIDHFVPWQYVAHDELWNLHPTTRKINSSKHNSLPAWSEYFDLLSALEYKAYTMKAKFEKLAKEFDLVAQYHLNNQTIRKELFYTDGLDEPEFRIRLMLIICDQSSCKNEK